MKYIVITGGVISGLGKGITASSIGLLLKNMGYNTTMIKIDPYLNVDAGTMSPYEHGEVFVLEDGSETDLDLGNYERFMGFKLTGKHNITSGKIYQAIINDERQGKYLGQTVQVVPHVTNKIKSMIVEATKIPVYDSESLAEICIIEVGGTIGDIESMHFIEAIRQLSFENELENKLENEKDQFCFIHISLVPKIFEKGEYKTKPTQNSVKDLRHLGIFPDIMIIRCQDIVEDSIKKKISLFCQVPLTNIIVNPNVRSIYEIPFLFYHQNILSIIYEKLSLTNYQNIEKINNIKKMVTLLDSPNVKNIIIIGKYTQFSDSYISIIRALEHASLKNNCRVNIEWISSELFEDDVPELDIIKNAHGVIIPGGFGLRGVEGMINIAKYCRVNKIPLLGICLGMHVICLESARNILGKDCHSTEFDSQTENPIIKSIEELCQDTLGGTMKLGLKKTQIDKKNSVYQTSVIKERHRHRYEINNEYVKILEQDGLSFTGQGTCMDIVEDLNHPFYIGCQYHPEFISNIDTPEPLFNKLVSLG